MNRLIPITVFLLFFAQFASAADQIYLEVSPENPADLQSLFSPLEESLTEELPVTEPIVVVLHGAEALPFTRDAYALNRELVDRAALLDAYRVIEVRMCETWLHERGLSQSDIPAFIETVPYAPEEIERLQAEGYQPLKSVDI